MNEQEVLKIVEQPFLNYPIQLLSHKTLIGANYFSGAQVIRFRLQLNEFDEVFTNQIPGFNDKLKETIPSLIEHHCSMKQRGGLFLRMDEGTLLGHVMEHVAIELQNLAGMNVGFGKTRETKVKGVYNVVIRFFDEYAGIYAGKMAIHILNHLLTNQPIDINPIIQNLIAIRERRLLGFSTQQIVNEAHQRGIPTLRLDRYNLVQLGTGCYRKIIRATITQYTSYLAVENTDDKYITYKMLEEMSIPVPRRITTQHINEALNFFHQLQKPLVIKPTKGYRGKRVNVHLDTEEKIIKAFFWAKAYDDDVIVQEFITGNTYRMLIINGKYTAAVQLIAPFIVGDGTKTIQQLIDELNAQPDREFGDKGRLSKVEIDEDTLKILDIKGYQLSSVLEKDKKLYLKNTGNMRLGATSVDVTDMVHPNTQFICERIARILNLDVTGIDIISENISIPLTENGGRVIEINAAPDFRMHINPTIGQPRHVEKIFIDMLFPQNEPFKIPIISITGSKGKTTLSKWLNETLNRHNYYVGLLNQEGIFINNQHIKHVELADSHNVAILLKDPTINMAILETPVESILDYGLGYETAHIGIFLNLYEQELYLEYDHIRDIEDIAYAKSVVVEEIDKNGFAIINADQPLVYESESRIDAQPLFFSTDIDSRTVRNLIDKGRTVAAIDMDRIVIYHERDRFIPCYFDEITHLPISEEHEKHVLLAYCLTLFALGFKETDIRRSLKELSI
ncbi:MAG: Mur ligase family protein [Bacteroidales bacterium]|nr:Mur ligase family protein [Bacteroidales bacterium]